MNDAAAARSRWKHIAVIGTAIVLVGAAFYTLAPRFFPSPREDASLSRIFADCARASDSAAIVSCTRSAIDTLLQTRSTSNLMQELSQTTVPEIYGGCHSISHFVGEDTFAKTNNLEQALAQCSSLCNNGCVHGAIGAAVETYLGQTYDDEDIAHASAAQIESLGEKYCAQSSGLCHGIGHLFLIALHDFAPALSACKHVASGFSLDSCEQGVFMQGVGGVGQSLVVGTSSPAAPLTSNDDLAYPCDAVDSSSWHACFEYLPSYENAVFKAHDVVAQDAQWEQIVQTCAAMPPDERAYCFEGVGRGLFLQSIAWPADDTSAACAAVRTATDTQSCMLGRVEAMIQMQLPASKAINYCLKADATLRSACFEYAFQLAASAQPPLDLDTGCAAAKDPETCRTQLAQYRAIRGSLPDFRFGPFGNVL